MRSLNGMWNFRIDDSPDRQRGFLDQWYSKPLRQFGPVEKMPVPASFNDIGAEMIWLSMLRLIVELVGVWK